MIFTAKKDTYRYRSGEAGEVIKVLVYYDKGGRNYFTGKNDSRGVWVTITPVTVEEHVERWTVGSGIRALVRPLTRKSMKAIEAVLAEMEPFVLNAVELAKKGELKAAMAHLLTPSRGYI